MIESIGNLLRPAFDRVDEGEDFSDLPEVTLCRRLVSASDRTSITLDLGSRYMSSLQSFDLVGTCLSSGQRLILEAKCHWPTYNKKIGRLATYKHLAGTAESGGGSSALDLKKLFDRHKLYAPDTLLGILLAGSYSVRPDHGCYDLPADFESFAKRFRIDRPPWTYEQIIAGANSRKPNYRRDVRLYLCRAADLSGWWATMRNLFGCRELVPAE